VSSLQLDVGLQDSQHERHPQLQIRFHLYTIDQDVWHPSITHPSLSTYLSNLAALNVSLQQRSHSCRQISMWVCPMTILYNFGPVVTNDDLGLVQKQYIKHLNGTKW